MNGEDIDHQAQDNNDSSDEEHQEKHMISLQERRRKYYEERKKKLARRTKPATIEEMLKEEDNQAQNNLAKEKRFLNVRVHTKVPKNHYKVNEVNADDYFTLKGELEIADYLTFKELVPKAIEIFNTQLKDLGFEIELLKEQMDMYSFRFAKKDGNPDTNFPAFDNSQKVSDCGVTNL